jgi:hypothetical protein
VLTDEFTGVVPQVSNCVLSIHRSSILVEYALISKDVSDATPVLMQHQACQHGDLPVLLPRLWPPVERLGAAVSR